MKRFAAIEGLRGWLAWTVVFSHIVLAANVSIFGMGPIFVKAGAGAVLVFVILSGFVITHLIVERNEPYTIYIWRRLMRVFPLFVVTSIAGYFAMDVFAESIVRRGQNSDWLADIVAFAALNHEQLPAHALAHLTLMHGAIPNNILQWSQYAFNPPAWSISLEWQFYLVAPIVVAFLNTDRNWWVAAALAIGSELVYRAGWFGEFRSPSLIFGALAFFAVGIVFRLGIDTVRSLNLRASRYIALILVPIGWESAPVMLWVVFFLGVISRGRLFRAAFESKLAQMLGRISYSTYLVHFPILALCYAAMPDVSRTTMFLFLTPLVCGLTLLASVISYFSIERPCIEFGSFVVRLRTPGTVAPAG